MSHAEPEDFLTDSVSGRASRSDSEGQLMCAVIAVTINRSFAPVGKSGGQWARFDSLFIFLLVRSGTCNQQRYKSGGVPLVVLLSNSCCKVSAVLYLKNKK